MIANYYLENGFRNFAHFGDLGAPYFRPRQEAFCRVIERPASNALTDSNGNPRTQNVFEDSLKKWGHSSSYSELNRQTRQHTGKRQLQPGRVEIVHVIEKMFNILPLAVRPLDS
jgi:predicted NAD/FAD-dependent oxidoreductase